MFASSSITAQSQAYLAHIIGHGVDPLLHCQGFERGAQTGPWIHLRIVPGEAPFLHLHCRECRLDAALKLAGCLVSRPVNVIYVQMLNFSVYHAFCIRELRNI